MKKKYLFIFTLFVCLFVAACATTETKTKYDIYFNYNYGENPNVSKYEYLENDLIEFPKLNRIGYILEGWYYDKDATNPVPSTVRATESMTFFANWIVDNRVKLSFDLNGPTGSISDLIGNTGGIVIIPECDINYEGYTFLYWTNGTDVYYPGDSYTLKDVSTSLYAEWKAGTKLSFNANGGNGEVPNTVYITRNNDYELPTTNLSKDGKEFVGWYDGRDFYKPSDKYYVLSEDVEFMACYEGTYNVKFFLNNQEITEYSTSFDFNEQFILPTVTLPSGKIFTGWFDGSNVYQANETYTMMPYDVNFHANTTDGVNITYYLNYYLEEDTIFKVEQVKIGDYLSLGDTPTRSNHNFVGWYKDEKCSIEWNYTTDKVAREINLYAKWEHEQFVFDLTSDESAYVISGRNKNYQYDKDLILPSTYQGKEVIGIADATTPTLGAFYGIHIGNSTRLEHIFIPKNYQFLGDYAFYVNLYVKTVEFESGSVLERIGKEAFYNFKNLTSIEIPSTVKEIGSSCFLYNSSLKSIDLSNTKITKVSDFMFGRCYELSSIKLPNTIVEFGEMAFNLCESLTEFTIPEGIETIPDYFISGSFCNKDFQDIERGQKQNFPDLTYYDCDMAITTIHIPASVKTISYGAFAWCLNLKTITFAEDSKLETIGDFAFFNAGLTEIDIPDSVVRIGSSAFKNSPLLETVRFTDNSKLEVIFENGFNNCDALVDINLPTSLGYIWYSAFQDCDKLEKIVLPEGLKELQNSAFYDCDSLLSVSIPSTLNLVGIFTFSKCVSLKNVVFTTSSSILALPAHFLWGCTSLEEITLPRGIAGVSYGSFMECYSLKNIYVNFDSTTLTSIDGILYTKNGKTLLAYPSGKTDETVTVKENVTTIGLGAFLSNINVKEVYFPASVEVVEGSAFHNCKSLEHIEFAENSKLNTIKNLAFANVTTFKDSNLTETLHTPLLAIVINATVPPVLEFNVFVHSVENPNFKIYVPKDSLSLYMQSETFQAYTTYLSPIE